MIYVVLGMHKSGTTLISEILHKTGISMVEEYDESVDYYAGNKMERLSILNMNRKLLNSENVSSLDLSLKLNYQGSGKQHLDHMRGVIKQCEEQYDDWGFKDPRTCITYDLWNEVLPAHKIIFVFRHPHEVMNHYIRRYKLYNVRELSSRSYKAINIWKSYNKIILRIIKSTNHPNLVINYDDLMGKDKDSMAMLTDFTGREVYDARNPPKNNRNINHFWPQLFDQLSNDNALDIYQELETLKSRL